MFLTFSLCIFFALILFGCANHTNEETTQHDVEFTKLSASYSVDQTPSNLAKELLSKQDAVKNIKAVNSTDQLLIGIEIDHMQRFRLKEIEKELEKEMKKKFDDYKIELSMDKKIVLELEELENKIQQKTIKKKKLEKEIDRIIKLSHEQT